MSTSQIILEYNKVAPALYGLLGYVLGWTTSPLGDCCIISLCDDVSQISRSFLNILGYSFDRPALLKAASKSWTFGFVGSLDFHRLNAFQCCSSTLSFSHLTRDGNMFVYTFHDLCHYFYINIPVSGYCDFYYLSSLWYVNILILVGSSIWKYLEIFHFSCYSHFLKSVYSCSTMTVFGKYILEPEGRLLLVGVREYIVYLILR